MNYRNPIVRVSIILLTIFTCFPVIAQIQNPLNTNLSLANGLDIPVQEFNANGKNLILWLPSEFGLRGPEQNMARQLQTLGVTTWIVDLHTAYFEPIGRSSLQNMPVKDIAEIIDHATKQHKTVYVLSSGRGAALSLLGIRERQIVKGNLAGVAGAILLYPNFAKGAPTPGENPKFVPITSHSNLPIYIFQPDLAARYWQLKLLRKTLAKGGSPVYAQVLKHVRAGFDIHETHTSDETTTITQLPKKIVSAIRILSAHKTESFKAVAANQTLKGLDAGHLSTGLQRFPQRNNIIPLHLSTLEGHRINLKDYKGKVVLLNFWTSWCPACVKELPSLSRLQKRLARNSFKILSINVAEPKATIKQFLQKVKVDFPVLIDPQGKTVKNWKLLAFPMSFVVDKTGHVRYGMYGALKWDNDEVIALIKQLIAEP